MFERILITGRGEVAARVERTCRRIGVEVSSGESEPETTRWRPDVHETVAAATAAGANAIHPGYVAPESRAALAHAARQAGLVFVGPSTAALDLMKDKLALRQAARQAGLRPVDGSDDAVEDVGQAASAASSLGYPVMLKPVAGTAGIGVRQVDDEEELAAAFSTCVEQAQSAFGDGRLYLEQALFRPRQIEVTVAADGGGAIALGERECSLQRHHQVLIAESPSPLLLQLPDGEAVREAVSEAALRFAESMGMLGIATFEFLFDGDGRILFLEANADMHGSILVTEMLTGIDPVELQLELAAGEALPAESRLRSSGHAFEVRVCAENPARDFSRSEGKVETMRFAPAPHGKLRIEPTLEVGEEVPGGFEPLLARMASFAPIRHQALLSLDRALAETVIAPIGTNLRFLRQVLNHESFRAGQYDATFAARLLAPPET